MVIGEPIRFTNPPHEATLCRVEVPARQSDGLEQEMALASPPEWQDEAADASAACGQ
jgi:hypothetical protein